MKRQGLALLEALLSLCLLTLISLGGLEVFSSARRVFFHMGAAQERDERAAAGLDRARKDIREAGRGLSDPVEFGWLDGVEAWEDGFVISCLEKNLPMSGDLAAGGTFLPLADDPDISAGREVCLFSPGQGETGTVASVRSDGIVLLAPLTRSYSSGDASILLIRKTEILWDRDTRILRRRVNAGTAQPLIEGVAGFSCLFDPATKILKLEIRLVGNEEASYAATVLAKNLLLAAADRE